MKKLSLLTLFCILLASCTSTITPEQNATVTPIGGNDVSDYEATPVRYIISEILPINETVTADGIEMHWEKVQFLATSHIQDVNQSLSVEVYLCFEEPNIDGVDMWIISSSELSINNANAEMDSYALIYDSDRSYMFEDISPNWQPIGRTKDCVRSIYPFRSSNDIIRHLAAGADVTTTLSLAISGLKGSDSPNNSLNGPWIFETVINP